MSLDLVSAIINPCPGVLQGPPANLFLNLINSLFAAQCGSQPPIMPDYGPNLNGDNCEFDLIVVGAGAAGAVVANRLSENSKWRVLLLEAGSDPSITSQVPSLAFQMGHTYEDWNYKCEPQPEACLALENQQCILSAGKALGGSTIINRLLYHRGNKKDYDDWVKLGNPGWSYEETLKYFKKSEDNLDKQIAANKKYHSTGGLLKIDYFREGSTPLEDIITKSASELGYYKVNDFTAGQWIGFGKVQGTVYNGIRQNTATAFLESVKTRPNLFIVKNAMVQKVNIVKKTAKGVQVLINGEIITVGAKKEVILSAGAIQTPKILMLSGVGPKDHLLEMNIPVVQDMQVGQNFQDQMVFTGLLITLKVEESKWIQQTSPVDTLYQYFMNRKGDLAGVNLNDFMGFINTDSQEKYPNIQFEHFFIPRGLLSADNTSLAFGGYNQNLSNKIKELNLANSFYFPALKVLKPKSRGYIKLRSNDPNDSPMIYTNYLTEQDDIETYLKGIRFMEQLLKTPTFSTYNPEIININLPECSSYEYASDDYWKCYLKYTSLAGFHPAGTAKMGPTGDKTAVVSPKLKVYGIKGLRVADASIMPRIVSGNTMAPCIMIGEKAADMIKEDWDPRIRGGK